MSRDTHDGEASSQRTSEADALIVQDDVFDSTASVTVAPLTTTLIDAPLLRVAFSTDDVTGLQHESQVMIDKITTVCRENLRIRVGRLAPGNLLEVVRAMMALLGLAR